MSQSQLSSEREERESTTHEVHEHHLKGVQLHCGMPSQARLRSGELKRTLLSQKWHAWA